MKEKHTAAQLLKSSSPENDSHETSFYKNFFLVTSSLYFRSAAVCASTTLIRPIHRRVSRHDTRKHFWENSLIIIFLWALRERGPSNNKTKLFFRLFIVSAILRWFSMIHEYYMRWVFHVICFLLLVQQPIRIQGPQKLKAKARTKGS